MSSSPLALKVQVSHPTRAPFGLLEDACVDRSDLPGAVCIATLAFDTRYCFAIQLYLVVEVRLGPRDAWDCDMLGRQEEMEDRHS